MFNIHTIENGTSLGLAVSKKESKPQSPDTQKAEKGAPPCHGMFGCLGRCLDLGSWAAVLSHDANQRRNRMMITDHDHVIWTDTHDKHMMNMNTQYTHTIKFHL